MDYDDEIQQIRSVISDSIKSIKDIEYLLGLNRDYESADKINKACYQLTQSINGLKEIESKSRIGHMDNKIKELDEKLKDAGL